MDINDKLKGVADGVTEKVQDLVKDGVEEKIQDVAGGVVDHVEGLADKVGLGEKFDSIVDAVEDKVNLDIDGDGKGGE